MFLRLLECFFVLVVGVNGICSDKFLGDLASAAAAITKTNGQGHNQDVLHAGLQLLFPDLSFNCDGYAVSTWTVGAQQMQPGGLATAQLQIWRPVTEIPGTYELIDILDLDSPSSTVDTNLFQFDPPTPMAVQSGDVVGMFNPPTSSGNWLVYHSSISGGDSGVSNLYITASTAFTVGSTFTSVTDSMNDYPLIKPITVTQVTLVMETSSKIASSAVDEVPALTTVSSSYFKMADVLTSSSSMTIAAIVTSSSAVTTAATSTPTSSSAMVTVMTDPETPSLATGNSDSTTGNTFQISKDGLMSGSTALEQTPATPTAQVDPQSIDGGDILVAVLVGVVVILIAMIVMIIAAVILMRQKHQKALVNISLEMQQTPASLENTINKAGENYSTGKMNLAFNNNSRSNQHISTNPMVFAEDTLAGYETNSMHYDVCKPVMTGPSDYETSTSIFVGAVSNPEYEWGVYVPTTIVKPAFPQFFEESDVYWEPGCDVNSIYEQLAQKKYREIIKQQIHTTSHLGSGQFGKVDKGVWQSPSGSVDVAIKTLQNDAGEEEKVKFLQEAAIMGQFHHPNIVRLHGVVTVGEPVMIVLELMENGDLRQYLLSLRPIPGEMVSVESHQLLEFCQQIASGMEYMSKKSFVHRDLAARNILVSSDRQCKIADFGLSRDICDDDYYVSSGGKIPIKWTAPEAILYKKYSTASDVWSFGALMYEIWSLGHKPFEEKSNQQVIELADGGYRLSPPPGCPRAMYQFMIQCWHPQTSGRPSFSSLVSCLFQSDSKLLMWSDKDRNCHPQAAVLGAPLEAGTSLYPLLQNTYMY